MKLYFYSREETVGQEEVVGGVEPISKTTLYCIPADSVSEAANLMNSAFSEWHGPIAICNPEEATSELFDVTEFQSLI